MESQITNNIIKILVFLIGSVSLFVVISILGTLLSYFLVIHSPCTEIANKTTYDPNLVPPFDETFFHGIPTLYHMQIVSTHNSYHQLTILSHFSKSWNYQHPPILTQLEDGVRGLEFDLHYSLISERWTVFHISFDHGTSCKCFCDCLSIIKDWSTRNPLHYPLVVILQAADIYDVTSFCYKEEIYDKLEGEILSVFSYEDIFFPKQMQGPFPSLNEALYTRGWPSIEKLRGKIMFVFIGRKNCHSMYMNRPIKMFFTEMGHYYRFIHQDVVYIESRTEGQLKDIETEKFLVKCCTYKFDTCGEKGAHFLHTNNHKLEEVMVQCNPVTDITC